MRMLVFRDLVHALSDQELAIMNGEDYGL